MNTQSGYQYPWLIWSMAFLLVWLALYALAPAHRVVMWKTSLLMTPFALFPVLYFLPWNSIYAGIAAMTAGAAATVLCRPDLARNTVIGGALFLGFYTVFLLGLEWTAPGYVGRVWNLDALSGVRIYGLPLEELLFGFSFGLLWAGLYEHAAWMKSAAYGDMV